MQQGEKVEDTVKRIIAECLERQPDEVSLQAHLVRDLGADSLDLIELQMALEEEFGFDDDAGAKTVKTVQDAVDYVQQRYVGPAAGTAHAADVGAVDVQKANR